MGTNQNLIDEIRKVLDQIKYYYTITQQSLTQRSVENHLSRRPASLSSERIQNCICTLEKFIKEKESFKDFVQTNKKIYLELQAQKTCRLSHDADKEIAEDICHAMAGFASSLYQELNILQRQLSCLSVQEQNQHHQKIHSTLDITKRFESALAELSDYITEHGVTSSAFSLARHMELLPTLYQRSYETNYNRYGKYSFGIFYSFKVFCRSSVRTQEIEFLSKKLSKHPNCTDEMRLIAANVMIKKIKENRSWSSLLKVQLEKGVQCSVVGSYFSGCIFEELNQFCQENQIAMHDELLCYLNKRIQYPETNTFF